MAATIMVTIGRVVVTIEASMGGSHGQSEDIDSLIEYQCEECGKEYLQHIPVVYLLAFAEQ